MVTLWFRVTYTYTLIISYFQSNQVRNSHAMELYRLKIGLQKVKACLNVSHLITDRHASIKKYMRDDQADIKHNFDIWHMVKGIINEFKFY